MWEKMEQNYLHFFWLTGETPETLTNLVERIKRDFLPYTKPGPNGSLDVRNKVSIFHLIHTVSIFGLLSMSFDCTQ